VVSSGEERRASVSSASVSRSTGGELGKHEGGGIRSLKRNCASVISGLCSAGRQKKLTVPYLTTRSQGGLETALDMTYTNKLNPKTWRTEIGHSNFSQPNPKLIIQIDSVLQVSVKLRAVALTYLVTLSPKKLKSEMLIAMAMPEYSTVGVWIN
jgi:hypothetical protein